MPMPSMLVAFRQRHFWKWTLDIRDLQATDEQGLPAVSVCRAYGPSEREDSRHQYSYHPD